MRGITHAFFGLFAALLLSSYLPVKNLWVFLIVAVFFSLVPDIDESSSKFGRRIRPFSLLLKHRGFIHSILFLFLAIVILGMIRSDLLFAVIIGFTSHLLLDGLTYQGVKIFWPLNIRIKGFCKSGGLVDHLVLAVSILGSIFIIII